MGKAMIFDRHDYDQLHELFALDASGKPTYAGYRPEVREVPNGDAGHAFGGGNDCMACIHCGGEPGLDVGAVCPARAQRVDVRKRYLHINRKYNPSESALRLLTRAHWEACLVADALEVPAEYYPRPENGTLRVLEYPSAGHTWTDDSCYQTCGECGAKWTAFGTGAALLCPTRAAGAGSAKHTDPNLFSIVCYRETPEDLEWVDEPQPALNTCYVRDRLSPGLHIGEIGEIVGLGPATPHQVRPRPYVQRSIVYFALPAHAARLPASACSCPRPDWHGHKFGCVSGITVREYLDERLYKRGRVPA